MPDAGKEIFSYKATVANPLTFALVRTNILEPSYLDGL